LIGGTDRFIRMGFGVPFPHAQLTWRSPFVSTGEVL
jgi:hypothetical protein